MPRPIHSSRFNGYCDKCCCAKLLALNANSVVG